MKKLFSALAFLTLFIAAANAPAYSMVVQDPQNLLSQVDQYLAQSSFTQAFQLGDDAEYAMPSNNCQMTCTNQGCVDVCQTVPMTMSRKVTAVAADQCTITLQDGNSEIWSETQFATMHGNSVREALTQLDQQIVGVSGTLTATQYRDRPYTLPSGKTYATKEIVFSFSVTGTGQSFFVRYTVSNELPFAAQIVQMAIDGSWRYQLTNYFRQQ